jgi:hypothetical protein
VHDPLISWRLLAGEAAMSGFNDAETNPNPNG